MRRATGFFIGAFMIAGVSVSCRSSGLEELEQAAISVAPFPSEAGGFARTGWRFDDSKIEAAYETKGALARGSVARVTVTFDIDAPIRRLLPGHLEQYLGRRSATERGSLSIGDDRFIFVNFEEEKPNGRSEIGCLAGRIVSRTENSVDILLISAWSDRFEGGEPTALVQPLIAEVAGALAGS